MKESVMKWVFAVAAALSILAVGLICVFLFANGVPAIAEIGAFDFLLGQKWKPSNQIYGIFSYFYLRILCLFYFANLMR